MVDTPLGFLIGIRNDPQRQLKLPPGWVDRFFDIHLDETSGGRFLIVLTGMATIKKNDHWLNCEEFCKKYYLDEQDVLLTGNWRAQVSGFYLHSQEDFCRRLKAIIEKERPDAKEVDWRPQEMLPEDFYAA